MTIEDMRWELYKVYPGDDWRADVAWFSPNKVARLYLRFLSMGKLKKEKK